MVHDTTTNFGKQRKFCQKARHDVKIFPPQSTNGKVISKPLDKHFMKKSQLSSILMTIQEDNSEDINRQIQNDNIA